MKKLLLTSVLFIVFSMVVHAGEIKAIVTVNMEQLEQDNRVDVQTLAKDIEDYINNQQFTELEWEGDPILINIQIYLTGGYNYQYSAQLFINSQRQISGTSGGSSTAIRAIEKEWVFQYQRGAMLSYNPKRFDSFVSLIDFYMLLIIGFDLDTYEELSGSAVYEIAKDIQLRGAGQNAVGYSTFDNPGDFSKNRIISELTDPRFIDFRKLITEYYSDGLDLISENRQTALSNLELIVRDMAKFKKEKLYAHSALIQLFFQAKSEELIDLFKGYKSEYVWGDLMFLDPQNTAKYQEAKDGK